MSAGGKASLGSGGEARERGRCDGIVLIGKLGLAEWLGLGLIGKLGLAKWLISSAVASMLYTR